MTAYFFTHLCWYCFCFLVFYAKNRTIFINSCLWMLILKHSQSIFNYGWKIYYIIKYRFIKSSAEMTLMEAPIELFGNCCGRWKEASFGFNSWALQKLVPEKNNYRYERKIRKRFWFNLKRDILVTLFLRLQKHERCFPVSLHTHVSYFYLLFAQKKRK